MQNTSTRQRQAGVAPARFMAPRLSADKAAPPWFSALQLTGCAAVAVVVLALAVLVWLVALRTGQDQRSEMRDRAEQTLLAQAATMAETVGNELRLVDQSLAIIQAAWQQGSGQVDLEDMRRTMPALTEVTDDLFISDENHVIRQDIEPRAIGQTVGGDYVTFPHGSLEQYEGDGTSDNQSLLLQGGDHTPVEARRFLMYLVRPLDQPEGWLVGASYKSQELTRLFAQSAVGFNGVVALVDTKRGVLQAVAGPAARRPKTDLAKTPLFAILNRSVSGTWLGETPIDATPRLHAFHRVAGRDLVVLVAETWAEVVAPADDLAAGARVLALVAIAMLIGIGAVVLWEFHAIRAARRQKHLLERATDELGRLRADATATATVGHLDSERLRALIDNVSDGIALFDAGLRLVQWNHPFLYNIGVPVRLHMPLDTLLRQQATAGLLAPQQETEAEIAHRMGLLRTGDPAGLAQAGADHQVLSLYGIPDHEGGLMLILRSLGSLHPAPRREEAETAAAEMRMQASVEW